MRLLLVIVAVLVIAGCAATPRVGDFSHADQAVNRELAHGAAARLASGYEPARTRFILGQRLKSDFGRALVSNLRQSGFAVREVPAGIAPPKSGELLPYGSYRLTFLVNELSATGGATNAYEVTLYVDSARFSRGFAVFNSDVVPLGTWAAQE